MGGGGSNTLQELRLIKMTKVKVKNVDSALKILLGELSLHRGKLVRALCRSSSVYQGRN